MAKIRKTFRIIGAAEVAPNLPYEFRIPPKSDDRETMKIALSLRRLQPEPWETIFERYQVGDVVDAKVTKIANFGAFARLEDSIEGLIHITELTDAVITDPNEVVSEGQDIKVKILKIEMERKRLGLSLKQTTESLAPEGYTVAAEAPLEEESSLAEIDTDVTGDDVVTAVEEVVKEASIELDEDATGDDNDEQTVDEEQGELEEPTDEK